MRGLAVAEVRVIDIDRPKATPWSASLPGEEPLAIAVSPSGRTAVVDGPELLVADGQGVRRVDAAVAGTVTDLAFAGEELTWRHAGHERRLVAPLPATCDPPEDVDVAIQVPGAAAGTRAVDAAGDRRREVPVLCRFAGGGWVDLPGSGTAQVAGPYAATAVRAGHRLDVIVRDRETLVPIGGPAPSDPDGGWALMSDGTVVVGTQGGYAMHRRDGTVTSWRTADVTRGVLVDEVARAIVWRVPNGPAGSTPIP